MGRFLLVRPNPWAGQVHAITQSSLADADIALVFKVFFAFRVRE